MLISKLAKPGRNFNVFGRKGIVLVQRIIQIKSEINTKEMRKKEDKIVKRSHSLKATTDRPLAGKMDKNGVVYE